jgi:hypothetical protein
MRFCEMELSVKRLTIERRIENYSKKASFLVANEIRIKNCVRREKARKQALENKIQPAPHGSRSYRAIIPPRIGRCPAVIILERALPRRRPGIESHPIRRVRTVPGLDAICRSRTS